MRGLHLSKELKKHSEDIYKFMKKTIYVKYYSRLIHNSEASKCTKKLNTLQVYA